MTLRIANGAGFLGDRLDAPRRLVESSELDYLTLEYLAELTMSILARARQKDPAAGFARDFIEVAESLCPAIYLQPQLRIVTNAGGVNPHACAAAVGRVLTENGSGELPVAVVEGDDLLAALEELMAAGVALANLDTGQPLAELSPPIVSANAYLGAAPIVEALAAGAKLVVTGRVADASLTVGPAIHEFGWGWEQWNHLAGGTVAGHLIECGAQVTGGYSVRRPNFDLADVGYPIALLEPNGTAVITKPSGSGGVVDRLSVAEQLVYEIGDPAHYLTPDVDVDFTTVQLEDLGSDRVRVGGASGRRAPDEYKVSLAYHDGFTASGQLLVYGRDCIAKAQASAQMVFARLEAAGYKLDRSEVELLGTGAGVGNAAQPPADLREVVLRLSVHDRRREAVERFTKEIAPLITSGPAGIAGYTAGRSPVRPVFAYWPTLVPKDCVRPAITLRTATQWAELA